MWFWSLFITNILDGRTDGRRPFISIDYIISYNLFFLQNRKLMQFSFFLVKFLVKLDELVSGHQTQQQTLVRFFDKMNFN